MSKFKPQFQRLLFIDNKIGTGKYPTCRSLADEYEVSEKTIQRDIEYMRSCLDSPVEYDSSKRGYYYSEPNYRIPWIDITESDLFALCIADRALTAYKNTPLYDRLDRIFVKIRDSLPEKTRVSVSWLGGHYSFIREPYTVISDGIWETLSSSIMRKKELVIGYRKPGASNAEQRRVRPYHIVSFSGEWYLIALCMRHNALRRFAVSRIESAELTGIVYEVPDDFSIDEYIGGSFGIIDQDETFIVTIRFSSKQAPYVRERHWHDSQKISENADGTVDLSFSAASVFEAKRWVLSWGAEAQVLEPAKLAQEINEEIQKMIILY